MRETELVEARSHPAREVEFLGAFRESRVWWPKPNDAAAWRSAAFEHRQKFFEHNTPESKVHLRFVAETVGTSEGHFCFAGGETDFAAGLRGGQLAACDKPGHALRFFARDPKKSFRRHSLTKKPGEAFVAVP